MATADLTAARVAAPGTLSRVYGLGSVFGKSLRDSRVTLLVFGVVLAGIMALTASQVAAEFGDAASRAAMAAQMQMMPEAIRGLLGRPVNIETLGGFLSWRTLGIMPVIVGIWSLVALSGTLAREAASGSLEFVVASPQSRRSVALQKLGAHVVALSLAMLLMGIGTWAGIAAFATLPGDEVPLLDVLAATGTVGLQSLAAGAVAFALAPILGRGMALAIGAVVLAASYLVNSYAAIVPAFESVELASYFGWTDGHRPLAGVTDWPPVVVLAGVTVALLAVGVVAFDRRDLGQTAALPVRGPRFGIGLGNPFGRSLAERLPAALAWGFGVGLYGLLIASSASAFSEALEGIPQMSEIVERFYPGVDIGSSEGMLQLAFMGFGLLLVGFAAAMLVAGWASDEGERRLELILGAPLTRFRWGLLAGAGVIVATVVVGVLLSALIAIGAAADGNDAAAPFAGSLVAGLYGAALAGIGLAVGGVVRAGLGAVVVGALTIGFYLVDFLGQVLDLPEAVMWLSLSQHLGQPLIGEWDVPGMIACGALALGGVLVSAWGLSRRDVAR
jgi:ABC-2 type transport system permease protein